MKATNRPTLLRLAACKGFLSVTTMRLIIFGLFLCVFTAGQERPQTSRTSGAGNAPVTRNRYLRPDDFKNVPPEVRYRLKELHCLIPQDVETALPHNLISGDFAAPGQRDWAAYCSVHGKSKVVVIWGGPAHCNGEPFGLDKPVDDDSIHHDTDPEQWGRVPPHGSFWVLSSVPSAQVVAQKKARIAEGEPLKSASHSALKRNFIGGENGVYCQNGKWQGLWYAD